ncbi:hypothetical protein U1E44_15910 [Arenibacter sp. GZD96]|uniref:hypothetical protein n=1 Tax=Aurantibrevibacter litoralis TaxID=3106030 RepID=UPI002AFE10D9|nr:hypothetical protein [Arenibacter sp. GZD-96]MEA1787588.1 hypothetical protein [Arenibacter sp. GZD-96]
MKPKDNILNILFFLFIGFFGALQAQIAPNVYLHKSGEDLSIVLRIMLDKDYFVYTEFETTPAKFGKTLGGFYTVKDDELHVALEFNSNFESDAVKTLRIPFSYKENKLVLDLKGERDFSVDINDAQELDGKWLMAGRVVDHAEQRRDTTAPRKTMKFLCNGHFQWIAYNTETMAFSGTGGGSFTSKEGIYIEKIVFFSRDASRVGAALDFKYDLKGTDWHHTGKSSKGDPLHEIWAKRLP